MWTELIGAHTRYGFKPVQEELNLKTTRVFGHSPIAYLRSLIEHCKSKTALLNNTKDTENYGTNLLLNSSSMLQVTRVSGKPQNY